MKIGFNNLRSLKDTELIELKSLTFLLGQNSSGKSTFLRSLPLLRQSVETKTKGPILWYGSYVDFGDFNTAIMDKHEEKIIKLKFEYNFKVGSIRYSNMVVNSRNIFKYFNNKKLLIELSLSNKKDNSTFLSNIFIKINDFNINLKIDNNEKVSQIKIDDYIINTENLHTYQFSLGLIPRLIIEKKTQLYLAENLQFHKKEIIDQINQISKYEYNYLTLDELLNNFNLNSNKELYDSFINKNSTISGTVKFFQKSKKIFIEDDEFKKFKANLITSLLPKLIYNIDNHLVEFANSINYIAPLRATAERYYRPQDLSIEEVDFQGKNLALVLVNLSDYEKRSFKNFCLENFNFYPEATITNGNISVFINFTEDSNKHNITDLGFGFSQIIPIITSIWTSIYKSNNRKKGLTKIFAIEQPELHLHPKLQGKFVDAIVNVINYSNENEFDIKFIIETHSETIINAIGNRIYSKKISNELVNVVLFNRDTDNTKIEISNFNEEGTLKNWPFGFFEENFEL